MYASQSALYSSDPRYTYTIPPKAAYAAWYEPGSLLTTEQGACCPAHAQAHALVARLTQDIAILQWDLEQERGARLRLQAELNSVQAENSALQSIVADLRRRNPPHACRPRDMPHREQSFLGSRYVAGDGNAEMTLRPELEVYLDPALIAVKAEAAEDRDVLSLTPSPPPLASTVREHLPLAARKRKRSLAPVDPVPEHSVRVNPGNTSAIPPALPSSDPNNPPPASSQSIYADLYIPATSPADHFHDAPWDASTNASFLFWLRHNVLGLHPSGPVDAEREGRLCAEAFRRLGDLRWTDSARGFMFFMVPSQSQGFRNACFSYETVRTALGFTD